jgi:hypothetical protein
VTPFLIAPSRTAQVLYWAPKGLATIFVEAVIEHIDSFAPPVYSLLPDLALREWLFPTIE